MLKYKHYIWDFDGTLYDSYPHAAMALYTTAQKYGYTTSLESITEALHVNFATGTSLVGLTKEQIAEFRVLDADFYFDPHIVPFPDMRSTLKALQDGGARHYLFTHSNVNRSVRYLADDGMEDLFTGYMTSEKIVKPKPDPDSLLRILDTYKIDPQDAVMVGDREIDVRCGRNAGIDGILVDGAGRVRETCATYRVGSLSEILDL